MINGAPTDNNAKLFKQGAHSVFDESTLKVGAEYDTPNWLPSEAQAEMDQAITKLGKDGFVGVYAANDGTAGGAIAAMKAAGINPSTIPTTGQDAELAAIQRILAGEQYMTVYKAIKPRPRTPPAIAVELLKGEDVSRRDRAGEQRNRGRAEHHLRPGRRHEGERRRHDRRRRLLDPAEICTGPYAQACADAGIQ